MIGAVIHGLQETLSDMARRSEAMIAGTRTAMTSLAIGLSARVKGSKLSGQVLRVRTGRLRRSINHVVTEADGVITGAVGTNVEYARRHEFGGRVSEQVKEHMRVCKQVYGRMLSKPILVSVRAHVRTTNLPERSFLRTSLAEMKPQIKRELADAIAKAVHGAHS